MKASGLFAAVAFSTRARILFVSILAMALCAARASARIETREYLLGDMDDIHYDGVGSVDDVYVNPALQAYLTGGIPEHPFDRPEINTNVPFTFTFPLTPGEQVTGATLTFGLRAREYLSHTDGLVFFDATITNTYGPYGVEALGWWPYTMTGSDERSLDLADALGDDLLFLLQDGQFDGVLRDDTGIDYAMLTLEVRDLRGDFDSDGDTDANDIDLWCDGAGFVNPGDPWYYDYDLNGDLMVDEDDHIFLVEVLVDVDGDGAPDTSGTAMGDFNLDGLFLLASSLSAGYDLTRAMRNLNGPIVSVYSDNDSALLGAGTALIGTMDGVHGRSAGKVGFTRPISTWGGPSQLVQIRWTPAMRQLGYNGDHFSCCSGRFVKEVLVPQMTSDAAAMTVAVGPGAPAVARPDGRPLYVGQ